MLDALPAAVRQVFYFIVSLILCYLCLWILAWMLHWCEKYGFLPWP